MSKPVTVMDACASEIEQDRHEMKTVKRLQCGFARFKEEVYDKHPQYFEQLAENQTPEYMVLSCSDSRVCPSIVYNFRLGESFAFRNIANMIPPYDDTKRNAGVGAAIQYAVVNLEVKSIVVIGHSRCGGIEALMSLEDNETANSDFIEEWVKIGLPARDKVKREHGDLTFDEQLTICEKESVNFSLKNLRTYPFVKERVDEKKLELYGGYYDFVHGEFQAGPKLVPFGDDGA